MQGHSLEEGCRKCNDGSDAQTLFTVYSAQPSPGSLPLAAVTLRSATVTMNATMQKQQARLQAPKAAAHPRVQSMRAPARRSVAPKAAAVDAPAKVTFRDRELAAKLEEQD
jgi:hypothetical protein